MNNRRFDNHKVYNVSYHIIWIPKYRKHILTDDIEKANAINVNIDAFEIMPDHIHLFIKCI